MDRGAWQATVHGVARVRHDLVTKSPSPRSYCFLERSAGKELACNTGDSRCRIDPWVGRILWSRAWQPTLVFLPGKSLGQRSLAGYGSWGHKELETTEATENTPKDLLELYYCFL